MMRRVIVTTENGYSLMPQYYPIKKGNIFVSMQKKSAVILERI